MSSLQLHIPFSPSLPIVTLSTDGACNPNPGPGSWACLLRFGSSSKEISGFCPLTTNNQMELHAVTQGLLALKSPSFVTVRSDSLIAVHLLNGTGKKPSSRKNPSFVQALLKAMQPHSIVALWVKGHSGDPDNERCDLLCRNQLLLHSHDYTFSH